MRVRIEAPASGTTTGPEEPGEGNSVEVAAAAGRHAWVRGHHADDSLGRWTAGWAGGRQPGAAAGAGAVRISGFFSSPAADVGGGTVFLFSGAVVRRSCGEDTSEGSGRIERGRRVSGEGGHVLRVGKFRAEVDGGD